jgi:pyridoxine 4-dehydrogenase
MRASRWSRRTLLGQGVVLGCAGALGRWAAAGAAGAGGAPGGAALAAAAGTVLIGGDMKVVRLGLGAMHITGDGVWGEPRDLSAARALLRRAVELGINFIDTADAYGPGVSERLIGEALYPYPRDLVIATKGGLIRPSRSEWRPDGRPQHLREACEASLKRLKLERIDLYQFHAPDPNVPLEDSLGALKSLQQAGKIRHIGLSNVDVKQLRKAQGVIKVVSVQNRYNVADRASEDVLGICEHEQMAFLPWGPLAQRAQESARQDSSLKALSAIAAERHLALPTAALAWLLTKSPAMLPIPGTSRIDHLEQNLGAAQLRLNAAEMRRIG